LLALPVKILNNPLKHFQAFASGWMGPGETVLCRVVLKDLHPSKKSRHFSKIESGSRHEIGGEQIGLPLQIDLIDALRHFPHRRIEKSTQHHLQFGAFRMVKDVLPDAHGDGVSAALMIEALEHAQRMGAACIWLGVNQENQRAQRFYGKHGFTASGTKTFRLGAGLEHDYVMVRALADATGASPIPAV